MDSPNPKSESSVNKSFLSSLETQIFSEIYENSKRNRNKRDAAINVFKKYGDNLTVKSDLNKLIRILEKINYK
jgi:Ca2+-binding EF-hand superfamily protein